VCETPGLKIVETTPVLTVAECPKRELTFTQKTEKEKTLDYKFDKRIFFFAHAMQLPQRKAMWKPHSCHALSGLLCFYNKVPFAHRDPLYSSAFLLHSWWSRVLKIPGHEKFTL
jgi:hypothetical protein